MEAGLLLDVVVAQRAPILRLLPGETQSIDRGGQSVRLACISGMQLTVAN